MKKFNIVATTLVLTACVHKIYGVQPSHGEPAEGVYIDGDHTGMKLVKEINLRQQDQFYLPGGWWKGTIVPYTGDFSDRWKTLGRIIPHKYTKPETNLVQEFGSHRAMTLFHWSEEGSDLRGLKPGRNEVEILSLCPWFEGLGGEPGNALSKLCVGYAVRVTLIVPEDYELPDGQNK